MNEYLLYFIVGSVALLDIIALGTVIYLTGTYAKYKETYEAFCEHTYGLHECSKFWNGTYQRIIDPKTNTEELYEFGYCNHCGTYIYRVANSKDDLFDKPWRKVTPEINSLKIKAIMNKPKNYKPDIIAPNNKKGN